MLDHPVWHSLRSGWSALAKGNARALRIDARYGTFGAAAGQDAVSLAALSALIPQGDELWIVGRDAVVPPDTTLVRTAMLAQMVAPAIAPATNPAPRWEVLTESDGEDICALALMTRPGPFRPLTHRLGRFIGIRREGRLVAMAGERMRLPGYTEVSGVCTHPDHRGRGYAGALMRIVAQAMLDRGDVPFLHAYAAHTQTIALYERLGFRVRTELPMLVVTR
ncbi:ribosomal protein S18 acetylase RimI-like enzyme [Sphingobium sp. OAS761]|nr:GNAT family N-acetyltransferase [Sphingobium sp. OAS761]MCP1470982.1 ribosomal protein S18 acetylase RimI-like enzyme [Sphingobium sp. OAS761]